MEPSTVKLKVRLESAIVDRTQWKSYVPSIRFDNTYVEFDVPASEIVVEPGDEASLEETTLTLKGLAEYVLDPLANAVEAMHNKWKEKQLADLTTLENKPTKEPYETVTKKKAKKTKQPEQLSLL